MGHPNFKPQTPILVKKSMKYYKYNLHYTPSIGVFDVLVYLIRW